MTDNERIAVLEVKMAKLGEIEDKLDELLALRNKGMGAFWLASGLVGTGIIGFLGEILGWFRG